MVDMAVALRDGEEIGSGGASLLTGGHTSRPTIQQIMADIADDMATLKAADGAFAAIVLSLVPGDVASDMGVAGKDTVYGAGNLSQTLRTQLQDAAADLAAFKAADAGNLGALVFLHTAASIGPEFLSGGSGLHPRRDGKTHISGSPYEYVGTALQAIAEDLAAIEAAGSYGATFKHLPKP